jgi:hypothetical protein
MAKSAAKKGAAALMTLRREAAGLYRSKDLRFTARRWGRRVWVGTDKFNPRRVVRVKSLKHCRQWFAFAKACEPEVDLR